MRIRIPSRSVCEKFHLIYELQGAQRGVNVLTGYYGVRTMKVVVDGRKVSKKYSAEYYRNRAYFKKKEIRKRLVLHELYHHIIEAKGLEMSLTKEEKEANAFARKVLMKSKAV